MTARILAALLHLEAAHALYRSDGKWYHHLKQFPGILFDEGGYLYFLTEGDYLQHPHLQHAKDLHVPAGISQIAGYRPFTASQKEIIAFYDLDRQIPSERAIRYKREIELRYRNQQLVDDIKKIYGNSCQVCGNGIMLSNGEQYAEVHHIVPLGGEHKGPDTLDNMLCVCPNDHVRLDYGVIDLDPASLALLKHSLHPDHVCYHNERIFRGKPHDIP